MTTFGKSLVVVVVVAIVGGGFWLTRDKEITPVEVLVTATTSPTSHEVIGTSVEGRPIDAFTYGTGSNHIVFVGGIHGGYEWNSVLLAYEFMNNLDANTMSVPENVTVTVIPSANPDGVYEVIQKEGKFTLSDAPGVVDNTGKGRFNANDVDLNRNFACKWQPTSRWRNQTVGAGTEAFSEPEAKAIRDFALKYKPDAFVFWHSQANAVYASECQNGILPATLDIMNAYAQASGYQPVATFDAYPVTGDAEGWLASINIPAITVELATHTSLEWTKNQEGIKALLEYYK